MFYVVETVMTDEPLIGPNPCGLCGGEYGEHEDGCKRDRERWRLPAHSHYEATKPWPVVPGGVCGLCGADAAVGQWSEGCPGCEAIAKAGEHGTDWVTTRPSHTDPGAVPGVDWAAPEGEPPLRFMVHVQFQPGTPCPPLTNELLQEAAAPTTPHKDPTQPQQERKMIFCEYCDHPITDRDKGCQNPDCKTQRPQAPVLPAGGCLPNIGAPWPPAHSLPSTTPPAAPQPHAMACVPCGPSPVKMVRYRVTFRVPVTEADMLAGSLARGFARWAGVAGTPSHQVIEIETTIPETVADLLATDAGRVTVGRWFGSEVGMKVECLGGTRFGDR